MQSLLENKKIVVGEHYVTMFGTQKVSTGAQVLGMLSPLFLTISLVLIMVGIGLPYWLIYGGTSYGIFQICASSVTSCSFSITELGTSHPDSKYDTKRVFSLLMRIFTLLIMISTNHVCKFFFLRRLTLEYHDLYGCDRRLFLIHIGNPDIYLPMQERDKPLQTWLRGRFLLLLFYWSVVNLGRCWDDDWNSQRLRY